MNRKLTILPLFFMLAFLLCTPFPSLASDTGAEVTATAETNAKGKNGFITQNRKTYYYKNNQTLKGFQKIEGKTYYFDKKGVMLTGFQKIDNKTYYFNKKGQMLTGLRKISKKYYYFNKKGVMQTGLKKIDSQKYYFNKKGVMQTGFQTISKKKYYFNNKGVMVKGLKKINKKYYYFNNSGVMQTGFLELNGITYYFDTKTGVKFIPKQDGTVKKINTTYAVFNKDGSIQKEASYIIVKGAKMHLQYYSDPKVSTEKLLAAILYAEAGNQKNDPVKGKLNGKTITLYKGHLAVGYVIANRMTSSLGMKEVIYQQYQFQPARNGMLTKYLENYSLVSTDCKNAAKVILNDLNKNTNSVPDFKRADFTWKNFWAVTYAQKTRFFNVYNTNEYYILQGHVFFNYTKKI